MLLATKEPGLELDSISLTSLFVDEPTSESLDWIPLTTFDARVFVVFVVTVPIELVW